MKFPYLVSIVLLGAGMAVAQCNAPSATSSTATSTSVNDHTPSAINPQTNSPDSIARFNPVTGQNADSQKNPNAVPVMTSEAPADTSANGQSATNTTVTEDPHNANSAVVVIDLGSDTAVVVPAGAQE